jgi:hypothetical protein
MTRRQFAFWLGFGLFSLSEKFRIGALDRLAAATMRVADSKTQSVPEAVADNPIHWSAAGDDHWRWYVRENYIDGQWIHTGITTPINKATGKRKWEPGGYLDPHLLPAEMQAADTEYLAAFRENSASDNNDQHDGEEAQLQLPTDECKGRHGRPPSRWLRSLHAYELRTWLTTIDVPEAGVSGMTFWEHLTRDHMFDAAKIVGLTEAEQAKLHAAAHFGY